MTTQGSPYCSAEGTWQNADRSSICNVIYVNGLVYGFQYEIQLNVAMRKGLSAGGVDVIDNVNYSYPAFIVPRIFDEGKYHEYFNENSFLYYQGVVRLSALGDAYRSPVTENQVQDMDGVIVNYYKDFRNQVCAKFADWYTGRLSAGHDPQTWAYTTSSKNLASVMRIIHDYGGAVNFWSRDSKVNDTRYRLSYLPPISTKAPSTQII